MYISKTLNILEPSSSQATVLIHSRVAALLPDLDSSDATYGFCTGICLSEARETTLLSETSPFRVLLIDGRLKISGWRQVSRRSVLHISPAPNVSCLARDLVSLISFDLTTSFHSSSGTLDSCDCHQVNIRHASHLQVETIPKDAAHLTPWGCRHHIQVVSRITSTSLL